MLGGRFKAERIDSQSAPQIQKTVSLTSLFQARLAETPKKPPAPVTPSEENPFLIENLEEKAGNLIG